LATTFLTVGLSSVANAQQTPPPIPAAPVFPNVDENSVDLTTGKFEHAITAVSIGQGDSALDATVRTANGQWRMDAFKGYVTATYGSALITVTLNGDSETFTTTGWPNGTITSNQAEGSSLTFSSFGAQYTYTKNDGTVAIFSVAKYANGIANGVAINGNINGGKMNASLISLQYPNGKKETTDYRILTSTASTPVGLLSGTVWSAVDSVSNNHGYQVKYNYSGPSVANLLSVTAINNGADYCAPNANSCSPTQAAATTIVPVAYTSSGFIPNSITDALGR
jgi:hypothetical protein